MLGREKKEDVNVKLDDNARSQLGSARFARLDLIDGQNNEKVVVCKRSFFTWTVHCLRYQFSSVYRNEVREVRRKILEGLGGQTGSGAVQDQDALVSNRRKFNAHLFSLVAPLVDGGDENLTASGRTAGRQTGATVPDIGDVKEPRVTGTAGTEVVQSAGVENKQWPEGNGVYDSFWKEKGPDIAGQQFRNVFTFEGLGGHALALPPDLALKRSMVSGGEELTGSEVLCKKISQEIGLGWGRERFDPVCTRKSDINCILSYLFLVAPKDEHTNLFSFEMREVKFSHLGVSEDLGGWGFEDVPPEYTTATCRLPGSKLSVLVDGLLKKHFQAGKSKEDILAALDVELGQAGLEGHREQYGRVPSDHGRLTEDEFRFCVTEMKNFTELYFSANH